MGQSRSYEIKEYRNKILSQICASEKLVNLLGVMDKDEDAEELDFEKIIPYKYVFPHEYIPDTIIKTDRFINFEISATIDNRNNVFKDLVIYMFVVGHEDVVKDKKYGGLWYDTATCELDNIFCENNILGVGETVLVSNKPYCPQQKFKGRLLTFVVKDFNNGLKNGK